MANLKALKQFVNSLSTDYLFNTGTVGSTSQRQHQMEELRRTFAQLQAQPDSKEGKTAFQKALLISHALSVITDKELHQCETWLEEE